MRSRRRTVIRLHSRRAVSAARQQVKEDNRQLVQDKLTQEVESCGGRHREVLYYR